MQPRSGSSLLQAGQCAIGHSQSAQRVSRLALERFHDPLGLLHQRARLAQAPRLELERLILSRLDPGRIDLVHDVPQVVRPAAHLVAPGRKTRLLLPKAGDGGMRLGHRGAVRLGVGEGIEDLALRFGVQQRLGLVLSVEVDQKCAELREHGGGGGASVHPGAGAALGGNLPPHHDAAVLDVEPQLFDPAAGWRVDPLEGALDHRLGGARADAAPGRALAQEQGEGVDQHRLPGPGLAGEHVEPRAELKGDVGDGGEISDPEFGEH